MTKMAFNVHTAEFHQDPHSVLNEFREKDPIHFFELKRFGATHRAWLITRYDDCLAFLKDNRITRDIKNVMSEEQVALINSSEDVAFVSNHMLAKDAPDHTRLRSLVQQAFTPAMVVQMTPRIEEIAEGLLNEMEKQDEVDIMSSYASPLPYIVLAEIIGIPEKDREQFHQWTSAIVDTSESNHEVTNRNLREFKSYLAGLIQEKRTHPQNDMISRLISVEENGDKLTEEELYSMLFILLVAGLETTVNLIGSGVLALLQNREQMELLKNQPALIDTAVEELLRYTTPVILMANRWVTTDFTYRDHQILRGDMIFIGIGAANRDPAQFENPERMDVTRTRNQHLSFGLGSHFCLGAPLARLEAQIAFRALLNRFPNINLHQESGEIHWRKNAFLRGLERLPVSLS
ncbi:Cytochrome P450 [compost metagenome]